MNQTHPGGWPLIRSLSTVSDVSERDQTTQRLRVDRAVFPWNSRAPSLPIMNRARPVNLGRLDTKCTLIELELLIFEGL
jgi:hypothetical protein